MTQPEIIHLTIGAVATLIFLLQNLSSLTDGGSHDGGDFSHIGDHMDLGHHADVGHQGLSSYLSIRNMVAFFMGYGWVAFGALKAGFSEVLSALFGVGSGLVFVVVSVLLLRLFSRFQEDGSLNTASLVGKTCTVYIAVGAGGGKRGKVLVDTPAGRVELQARTAGKQELKAGDAAAIEKVEGGVLWITAIADFNANRK